MTLEIKEISKDKLFGVRKASNYGKALYYMREVKTYTKQMLIDFYIKELGKTEKEALSSVNVLLSPRITSKIGDCRGNVNNKWGHLAYNKKLERRIDPKTGEKEKQRYMLMERDKPLEKQNRKKRIQVMQEKEIVKIKAVKKKEVAK